MAAVAGSPRILICTYALAIGGAERLTANIASAWAARGAEVRIVTLAGATAATYPVHPAVRVEALRVAGTSANVVETLISSARRVWVLRKEVRSFRPDVVIGMMFPTTILTALAGRGRSTIGWEQNFPPALTTDRLKRISRKYAYGLLPVAVCPTEGSSEWLLNHTWVRRVATIPNGVRLPIPSIPPTLPPEAACRTDRKIVLAAGRLCAQKNFEGLISAFERVAARHPGWDLVILGEGEDRFLLEALRAKLGLGDRVFLPGYAGNIADWYRRANLFALSSRFEGSPGVLVEAMAHGLPAVSFDCREGPREILRSGVDGILVPPADDAAFADALSQLMGNSELASRMAVRAAEVQQRFSESLVLKMWDELFYSIGVPPMKKMVADGCGGSCGT